MRIGFILAGVLGSTGLALDAFGAHGLETWLVLHQPENIAQHMGFWATAVRYQIWHAFLIGIFAIVAINRSSWSIGAGIFLAFAGIVLFCGPLFVRVLTPYAWVTKLAPYGGVALMLSWLCLGATAFSRTDSKAL